MDVIILYISSRKSNYSRTIRNTSSTPSVIIDGSVYVIAFPMSTSLIGKHSHSLLDPVISTTEYYNFQNKRHNFPMNNKKVIAKEPK